MTLRHLKFDGMEPERVHHDDAGYDLRYSPELLLGGPTFPLSTTLRPGERGAFATGLKLSLPSGYAAFVMPRSGLALKHGITVLNAPGVVDAGFRGEIKVILINHGQYPVEIRPYDRIAQLVIQQVSTPSLVRIETPDGLGETARGESGFGSTGVQ